MSFLFDTQEEQEARKNPARPEPMRRGADTDNNEIALGTRSLLGIFFGLVLICAIFFGLGYSVGRGSGSRAAAQVPDATAAAPGSQVPKPSPQLTAVEPTTPDSDGENGAAATTPVSAPALQPASAQTQGPASAPGPVASTPRPVASTSGSPVPAVPAAAPKAVVPTTAPAPKPVPAPAAVIPAAATVPATFMVQVAAVRLQQDAQILVDALKKHGYTAVVRNEPQDQLMHVQLGPFASAADANAMRARLLADGYNAIVK